MSRAIYLLAILSYILSSLFPSQYFIRVSVSALCMLEVCVSLRDVRGLALLFGGFFLSAGSLMLFLSHAQVIHFVTSFGEMIQMVTLFALIPILSLPIRYGHYSDEVRGLIQQKINSPKQFYALTSGISFFFSSFMNLAALPMTYQSIYSSVSQFPITNKNRYLSRAITHGYAMPLLWSPITPIVGTVLYLTGTAYSKVLPYLLLLSIGGLLLDWGTANRIPRFMNGHWQKTRKEIAVSKSGTIAGYHSAKLLHIAGAILLLNGIITLLDHYFNVSFLFLVSLIVLPFAYFWSALIGQAKPFFSGVRHHFQTYIPKMQNQFFIFLTAGFFITALRVSHADAIVTQWVDMLIQVTGLRVFLVVLPFIPFALAFIGLHPAVGLALISEALRSQVLHQSPIVVTVAMLGGAIPAFLMGPYNATLGMMSSLIDEKPFTLSNWNFSFTMLYLALLTVFVQCIYSIL
ncbi:hypothetical protein [Sporolactobacillus laevolacticus]|uniref:hypothetical protein n=1 Tax=Sporolactobacillus laevolacticus TaxID=33018 RepID=UPI0004116449|nr:hypothetical protein [Sporolactobacillus laevolacticus]